MAVPRRVSRQPLRPQDAFFSYVETPRAHQQVGAVIVLGEGPATNPSLRLDTLRPELERRLAGLPLLRRTLVRRGWWRRPVWLPDVDLTLAEHVREQWIDTSADTEARGALVDEFLATPLAPSRPPWEMRLVHDRGGGASVILARMHHTLGDGAAVLGTMIALLADEDLARAASAPEPGGQAGMGWNRRLRRLRKVLTGLRSLAAAGAAPSFPSGRGLPDRDAYSYCTLELPTAEVQAAARAYRVNVTTFLLTVIAEALRDTIGTSQQRQLRALVPKTARAAGLRAGTPGVPGNWSAALTLDLPVGPMSPAQRLAAIASRSKALERAGQPWASQAAMAAFGRLPAPLHARLLRRLYGYRHFNLIVTVLPGPRGHPHLAGTSAEAIYPLIPLADGVGLGVCTLRWVDVIGVGVTTDPGIVGDATAFAARFHTAFDTVRDGA